MSDARDIRGAEVVEFARNTAVVLKDPGLLFGAGYKVLRSQGSESLVPCSRMDLNGKPVLVYFTRGYVTLGQFARESNIETVCQALRDLVSAVMDVRGNGFLSDRNLLLDGSSVYVDPAGDGIRLIYVPLTVAAYAQSDVAVGRCVYELAQEAVKCVDGVDADLLQMQRAAYERGDLGALHDELLRIPQRSARDKTAAQRSTVGKHAEKKPVEKPATKPASKDDARARSKADTTSTVDSASRRSETPPRQPETPPRQKEQPPATGGAIYVLTARTARGPVNYRISAARTVLGKSGGNADTAVGLSGFISPAHCELCIRADGSLSVKDLQSTNGTFVNGRRLQPNVEVPLAAGSTLKLADVTFLVQRVR